jgi:queuine tRNA-ribosyltransferase
MSLSFKLLAVDGLARKGRLRLPHGVVETPAFMPVGTLGAVKAMTPSGLEEAGASIMLANLYHLSLRPGIDAIASMGGLHKFVGWEGPILTDSGGFQVFSLGALRQVTDRGVVFQSHLDGQALELTPESVVEAQVRMGVDIGMILDECSPWPVDKSDAEIAVDRTTHWAERAREAWSKESSSMFGIVQGSVYPDLRIKAAEQLVALDFAGYAIGGVSVGEPSNNRRAVVEMSSELLPAAKPRYLMGLGTPVDILHGVQQGVDLFDCVLPSRNARHGVLYTKKGVLRIKNSRFKTDTRPIDDTCECVACRSVSRAFVHHLIRAGEITGAVLATQHNIRFYLDFVNQLREAIVSESLAVLASEVRESYPASDSPVESSQSYDSAGSIP